MASAMPSLSTDDSMGLETPNFFNSAWNPEQSDFSFTEAFAGNHSAIPSQLLQGQAENNGLDYFSCPNDNQFGNQPIYHARHLSGEFKSHDDLDRILEDSGLKFSDADVDAIDSVPVNGHFNQIAQMQGLTSYDNPLYASKSAGIVPINDWNADIKPPASPPKLMTQIGKDVGRRTTMRFGQITPVDSPPDDFSLLTQKVARPSPSKNKGDHAAQTSDPPKVKKMRKSKKKPITKEQAEIKRKRFLERNRLAADKCRQNRKKWVDDLQAKVHGLGANITAKKAQTEEVEQELAQLRSLVFIHSRSCNKQDIVSWVEQEAIKVQNVAGTDTLEDKQSMFDQDMCEALSPTSQSTSSHDYGSASELRSHRYSDAITGDDFASVGSGQSSRRPSTVL